MWRGIPSKTHCRLCSFLVKNAHQSKSTGVLTVEEPFPWERKFIVFESYLRELLINCTICGQAVGNLNFSVMGTLDVIGRVCERLHKLWWRSQQLVRGSGAGAGNFLLAAGMLYSCCVVATTIRCLGAQIITECAFYNYQRAYLLPAVKQILSCRLTSLTLRQVSSASSFLLHARHPGTNWRPKHVLIVTSSWEPQKLCGLIGA
ncbi:uncharacterized protein LOC119166761 isoform X4 [Rhipicephalus microplus]|uniref:uncharacterized protein LOC119166761 isoform X4 n=1 Tax=Rhipicephalus microplus TaxID=6941 RepID=UPI003F6C465B